MGQVTIYLDPETEQLMQAAAAAAGLSRSRWIAQVIRERALPEWPLAVRELAGSWEDFPDSRKIREGAGMDAPREHI